MRLQVKLSNMLSNKECFETFVHEVRHALQSYFVNNITHDQRNEWTNMMYLNTERKQNKSLTAYFSIKDTASTLLYMLQPTERDAFMFADNMCKQFNDLMHDLYPNDETFDIYDSFSNFNKSVESSKQFFNTQVPFEDIDDIIRHINGKEPLKPLNQDMWEAVQNSQNKSIFQQMSELFFCEDLNAELAPVEFEQKLCEEEFGREP